MRRSCAKISRTGTAKQVANCPLAHCLHALGACRATARIRPQVAKPVAARQHEDQSLRSTFKRSTAPRSSNLTQPAEPRYDDHQDRELDRSNRTLYRSVALHTYRVHGVGIILDAFSRLGSLACVGPRVQGHTACSRAEALENHTSQALQTSSSSKRRPCSVTVRVHAKKDFGLAPAS